MADLKQTLAKPIAQKKPVVISMPLEELQALVDSLHKNLEDRMDKLEQRVLLMSGKVNALYSSRTDEEE